MVFMGLASSSVHVSPMGTLVEVVMITIGSCLEIWYLESWPHIKSEMIDIHSWNSFEWCEGKEKIKAK